MEEADRKHERGRVFSNTGNLTTLLTVVATILATLSIAFPWYHLTSSDEFPSTTYPYFDYTYYLTKYSYNEFRCGGLLDYETHAIASLMLTELMLIGCWVLVGVLSIASHLFRWMRIRLASALGAIAISILTVTVFAVFIAGAVESWSRAEIPLEGFIGTAPGSMAYDYSYGPLIGWWIALSACAIQSASSLLQIGFGRKL